MALLHSSSTRSEANTGANTDSSLASSPRQFPTDLTSSILEEEEADESASEPANEPVTPVSGRQSQEFHSLATHEIHPEAVQDPLSSDQIPAPFSAVRPGTPGSKPPLILNTAATPPPKAKAAPSPEHQLRATLPKTPTTAGAATGPVSVSVAATTTATTPVAPAAANLPTDQEPSPVPLSRRSTRGSNSNFKRTMSSIFKRSNSQTDKAAYGMPEPAFNARSESSMQLAGTRKVPSRRWSMNKSSATTRSNTPPSPSSPLEMVIKTKEQASIPTLPNQDAFFDSKKKARASTGFNLRSRAVNFIGNGEGRHQRPTRRRASSFDYTNQDKTGSTDGSDPVPMERSLWGMPAETGTGVKARRMSLSLPDDFTIDVVELQSEFEYLHKLLGRHGKHLGKGATSKVTLMLKKGTTNELYAVKEFRGKSSSETRAEYEKKIKSEFTVAKSLHHPNIVETVRLCTDHGRWNHVMEYCSEGDLFSLVNKKYLTRDDREKDRLCLFKQLIQGVNYLHSNGIAHRDIKLENLLVTADSKLKITDFGVSEVFSGIHPGLREAGGQCGMQMTEVRRCAPGICGSEPYIAPEVLKKAGHYDPRALDVWSSAIVMINLIFGAPLWTRADVDSTNPKPHPNYVGLVNGWEKWNAKHPGDEMVITDVDYPYVKAFDYCVKPPALRRVLLQMLNPDPDKRSTIADIVNNRWIKNIECCQLESYEDTTMVIDASKKLCLNRGSQRKIFCHSHLPLKDISTHSLGKMPGSAGY
ncbi:kinase-like domain-containing protein [Cercophora scortea]|uniref:Kinase-like domain-containing protein n=1 Tax=Cercophora scortea TaxID=314031 RepID=A0AAE0J751_9PEZI|nr:kinase-like domain-containing protein [Cercophora scortea]